MEWDWLSFFKAYNGITPPLIGILIIALDFVERCAVSIPPSLGDPL